MSIFNFLKKKQSEPTIAEEAGLPDNWVPVEAPVIRPGIDTNGPHQYPSGTLPQILGLQPDLVDTKYGGGIPSVRLMPIANNAASGASAISNVLQHPQVKQNFSQTTANTSGIAANTTGIAANTAAILTLQQTNFQGVWSSSVTYQTNASVDYLGTLYYSLIANNLNNNPASSPTDWKSLGSDAGFIGAWSSLTAYKTSQQVTATDGNYYIALSGNTNVNPVGNPATWQLVGPVNLGSLVDGSSRYAATGSTLTYRPLTNPLSSSDAGASATISIASFTLRTPKGDISVNSGSITSLSYSTLFYVFYDDAALAGGSVTFNTSATKSTAMSGSARFFIGSIVTPAATAPNTVGNNDGGVGAQAGSTSVFLGGSSTTVLTTNLTLVGAPTNFYDGSLTTFFGIKASTTVSGASTASYKFKECLRHLHRGQV
jgi:hypothetical protein